MNPESYTPEPEQEPEWKKDLRQRQQNALNEMNKKIAESSDETERFYTGALENDKKTRHAIHDWVKRTAREWHDNVNPDYVFATETSALPAMFALKQALKIAYPTENPVFLRINPDAAYKRSHDDWLTKRVTHQNPNILVFDEIYPAHGKGDPQVVVKDKQIVINEDDNFWKSSNGRTCQGLNKWLTELGKNPTITSVRGGGPNEAAKHIIPFRLSTGEIVMNSRAATSNLGRKIGRMNKTVDEMRYTEDETDDLRCKGWHFMTGRIVKDPKQRERALAWVKWLQDIGKEAGADLKAELEAERGKTENEKDNEPTKPEEKLP